MTTTLVSKGFEADTDGGWTRREGPDENGLYEEESLEPHPDGTCTAYTRCGCHVRVVTIERALEVIETAPHCDQEFYSCCDTVPDAMSHWFEVEGGKS